MISHASMEGDRPLNGDLPSFVPVETILKEDVNPITISNLPKDIDLTAKQWDCNLCSPLLRKALQRERLQAMRQNPSYREMERLRQRSMMQLKRQDPGFRALERERQRARMQLRRQDPSFRAMERERQRRRMRLKRRDPAFREREREQQKTRLLVKRSGDKLPVALDVSSSSSSTPASTPAISTQAPSQLALPAPPHQQTSGHTLQSHAPAHHPSSSPHPQSQQSNSQQHGKGAGTLGNCLVPHDIQKRDATALYGHLQRIVGYHNLLQVCSCT
ncbi:hypothetical protein MTO96_024096 [Rhipicephalus appendiculatus]